MSKIGRDVDHLPASIQADAEHELERIRNDIPRETALTSDLQVNPLAVLRRANERQAR